MDEWIWTLGLGPAFAQFEPMGPARAGDGAGRPCPDEDRVPDDRRDPDPLRRVRGRTRDAVDPDDVPLAGEHVRVRADLVLPRAAVPRASPWTCRGSEGPTAATTSCPPARWAGSWRGSSTTASSAARSHLVAPDVGTAAALFTAALRPGPLVSVVVGSGGAAVPIQLDGPLAEWVAAPDLDRYRAIDPRAIVGAALDTIHGYALPPEIREDYLASYDGDRFVESMRYVRSYPDELPELAERLPEIETPGPDHRRPPRPGRPARQRRVPRRAPAEQPPRGRGRRPLRVGGGGRRVRVPRLGLGDGRLPRRGVTPT